VAEHGETLQQALLIVVEQVVAPCHRLPHGPLPLGQIARAMGQQRQRVVEP
jgi:hypothetical protein